MWNPLASLPQSNAGALTPYTPPTNRVQQAPVAGQTLLNGIYANNPRLAEMFGPNGKFANLLHLPELPALPMPTGQTPAPHNALAAWAGAVPRPLTGDSFNAWMATRPQGANF